MSFLSGCQVGCYFKWSTADIGDQHRLPAHTIKKAATSGKKRSSKKGVHVVQPLF